MTVAQDQLTSERRGPIITDTQWRDLLERRATDEAAVIDARMARATNEVSHWDGYDYVLVNDDVDACFRGVKTILAAERTAETPVPEPLQHIVESISEMRRLVPG